VLSAVAKPPPVGWGGPGAWYVLVNRGSRKVLDAADATTAD
jgi:hypothetical protein